MSEQPIIVIKKIKKGGGHAHHGGSWKIAYADFVTAMMAFFLLMWLLNMTTAEQKEGLSNYFDPKSIISMKGGSIGIMGGLAASIEETQADTVSEATAAIPVTSQTATEKAEKKEEEDKKDESNVMSQGGQGETDDVNKMEPFDGVLSDIKPNTQEQIDIQKEEKMLESVEQDLKEKISQNPEIQAFSENILMEMLPEGLRIQIIDDEPNSMFASGSTQVLPPAKTLLLQVGQILSIVPNQLKISGHTDANPYSNPRNYDNYDLSSDRANASRRILLEAGVRRERIHSVLGMAASEPHLVEDPKSPRNRRISILIMREHPVNGANKGTIQSTNFGASQNARRAAVKEANVQKTN